MADAPLAPQRMHTYDERLTRLVLDYVQDRLSMPETPLDHPGEKTEVDAILDKLGMTPYLDTDVATLSGGQAKRVALARALIWAAAWDMLRDAELPMGDFLTLVESGLPSETDISVVTTLLSQTKAAIEQFAGPGKHDGYRDRWSALLLRLVGDAQPGSDNQLAFARAYAATARTPEQTAVVRTWLEGGAPEGLVVDTDLRWTFLQRLIAQGAADPAEIETELEHDDTATGRRQAATAQALVPTMAAKEEAFAAAVESDDLPNALLVATIAGFVHPDQSELHRAFLDRYFDAIPHVWATRTNETAQTIVTGLYPSQIIEPEMLEITDRFLARDDVPSGARRLVREGRDGIERSLRCRACDS